MGECWRDVVGYEGLYKVSDEGRVLNVRTGRYLNGCPNADGYICVKLTAEPGQGRMHYLHRLVCLAFNGPPASPKLVVNHLNASKADCRPSNLSWCSRRENNAHEAQLGLYKGRHSGSKNPKSKLTEEVVVEMRRRSSEGVSYSQPAREAGVTPATAYKAVVGISWKHIALSPEQFAVAVTR